MKLVRDYIPEIIEESGKTCFWHKVKNYSEHMQQLKLKIIEETDEFIEKPCLEEAADMLEVIRAFISINKLNFDEVLQAAQDKAKTRGGFTQGIILGEVFSENR